MQKTFENINQILAAWNPIEVPDNIVFDEYKIYIPLILQSIENRQQLMSCLEDILINKMGLDYDASNKENMDDLVQVCDELIQISET